MSLGRDDGASVDSVLVIAEAPIADPFQIRAPPTGPNGMADEYMMTFLGLQKIEALRRALLAMRSRPTKEQAEAAWNFTSRLRW